MDRSLLLLETCIAKPLQKVACFLFVNIFTKTRSCLISGNNISLNNKDAIGVFLNPALAHILIKVYKNMILPSLLNIICKEYHLTQFQGITYSTEVSCVTLETYNL